MYVHTYDVYIDKIINNIVIGICMYMHKCIAKEMVYINSTRIYIHMVCIYVIVKIRINILINISKT